MLAMGEKDKVVAAGGGAGVYACGASCLIDEGHCDATDKDYAGWGWCGCKAVGSGSGESGEFGDVARNSCDTNTTDDNAITKNRDATGIHGIGITVVDIETYL